MWDLEEGSCIAPSRPLGCVISAVSADMKILLAGGTGLIYKWMEGVDSDPHLFDIRVQTRTWSLGFWSMTGQLLALHWILVRFTVVFRI